MTAIAGFTDGKQVWIGADSAGVAGFSVSTRTDSKVFMNGEMIMGFTSSFRMGQILEHHLSPPTPKEGQDDYGYMVKEFIPAVKSALSCHGWMSTVSGKDAGGQFIVGYRGKLYSIHGDFQVATVAHNYMACGCGDDLSLGAFHALDKIPDHHRTPEERITAALEAAAEFSAGVKAPFTILSTKLKESSVKKKV